MDFAALYGANYFLRRHRKKRQLLLAAALGAGGGLAVLLLIRSPVWYTLLSHLLINTIMVFAAFGRGSNRELLENWAVTYLMNILSGGVSEWFGESRILPQDSMLVTVGSIAGVYGIVQYLMRRKNFKNHIVEAQLENRGKYFIMRAYWDSGNQLRDPYTGQGVCILSQMKSKEIFDREKDHFRLVPYQALGKNEGMLWVTDVDKLLLFDGKKKVCLPHVAIGVANAGLLEEREYDLILHTSFL